MVLGSFRYGNDAEKMEYPLVGQWLYEKRCNARTTLFYCAFGDQGYFLTKTMFNELGGIPNQCVMEDFHFSGNARNYALMHNKNIFISKETFYTSPRKLFKSGRIWKNSLRNQRIVYLYEHCGYSPQQIYEIYYGVKLPKQNE